MSAEAYLWIVIAILLILPPKYDPAIRLKEWQIKKGWHPESKDEAHDR